MAEQVRETREFDTPGGHKVILRTYLTGKESNELKAIMYADLKIDASDAASGKVSLAEMPAEFMLKQEQKAMEFLVVSVDDNPDGALANLENLPEVDYNAVLSEVQKIRVPFKKEQ
jgi:hypothetical protein